MKEYSKGDIVIFKHVTQALQVGIVYRERINIETKQKTYDVLSETGAMHIFIKTNPDRIPHICPQYDWVVQKLDTNLSIENEANIIRVKFEETGEVI